MSKFWIAPQSTIDRLKPLLEGKGGVQVACDACSRLMSFDEMADKSCLVQDESAFYSYRDHPEAAWFWGIEAARTGAKANGWIERGDTLLCPKCASGGSPRRYGR
jgi:hypothetical protein